MFPFKRNGDQTVIPNRLTESKQYLAPSSALNKQAREAPPDEAECELIHVLELRDSGIAAALCPEHHQSLEHKLNFGSDDDVSREQGEVTRAAEVSRAAQDIVAGLAKEGTEVSTRDVTMQDLQHTDT